MWVNQKFTVFPIIPTLTIHQCSAQYKSIFWMGLKNMLFSIFSLLENFLLSSKNKSLSISASLLGNFLRTTLIFYNGIELLTRKQQCWNQHIRIKHYTHLLHHAFLPEFFNHPDYIFFAVQACLLCTSTHKIRFHQSLIIFIVSQQIKVPVSRTKAAN